MKLIAEATIALNSPDHICPVGTINDNYSNLEFVAAIKKLFPGRPMTLLDLGCAGGQLAVDFIRGGDLGVGVEGSNHALSGAGKNNWLQYKEKNLFLGDICKKILILNDANIPQKFDVVHSSEVMEHLNKEGLPCFFENILRHLKDDGLYICQIGLGEDIRTHKGKSISLHQSRFSPQEWINIMESNGLKVCDGGISNENHFGFLLSSKYRAHGFKSEGGYGGSMFACLRKK